MVPQPIELVFPKIINSGTPTDRVSIPTDYKYSGPPTDRVSIPKDYKYSGTVQNS